jgi:glycosyltransferase involved in cell wall biosynthesis
MLSRPNVSVIICTHNNADSLRKTLHAFGQCRLPEDWNIELIVVDNASTDETAVVSKEVVHGLLMGYVFEAKKGLSNARNAGLKAARGEAILFTDDDVIPSRDWIERMAGPLLDRECDAITGRVQLAKDLMRSWMQPMHDVWLAAARVVNSELVGACMGFHRSVLDRVPAFDSELGAGALGFAEETLFSNQLLIAGYHLNTIEEPCVEHYPRASRFVRREWLSAAKNRGRSSAYVLHHWEHSDLKFPLFRSCYYQLKLWVRRIVQPPPGLEEEGAPEWELSYLVEAEKYHAFIKERSRPRNYERHGLRKKAGSSSM